MALIKMEALVTFDSYEGHVKKGQKFTVNTITRALQLEYRKMARRLIEQDEPITPGPSERQIKKPDETKGEK